MTREKAILHMILRRAELEHSVSDLDEDIKAFDMAIKALEREPKLGHWDKKDLGHVEYSAVCSECGEWTYWSERSNFCPNCGCRMVDPQESEDKE
jgi:hypothetical protein